MKFYTNAHKFYCGADLHTKTIYLCILDQESKILMHKNILARPAPFLEAIAPYREDVVVGGYMILFSHFESEKPIQKKKYCLLTGLGHIDVSGKQKKALFI